MFWVFLAVAFQPGVQSVPSENPESVHS